MKNIDKLKPSNFESKWQKIWEEKGVYQPDLKSAKRPFYNLMMFPYPSAEGLHVGNMYAFTGADIYGRFKRMQGYDVFEPIGLDGFGIHSENYAIKIGKHPSEQAKVSEKNFYRQLHAIGNGFAWKNTLETYDPDYYRWTQWIFVQMFKHGLAYRKKSPVNFCPSCKTVLSDEQVIDGSCERCKSLVEKRDLEQWYFKITKYADKLLKNLETLDWTNKVKIGQRNWIGKKEGINITYDIEGTSEKITVFTTRPDTNFGATFIVLAPEHPFVNVILGSPDCIGTTPGSSRDSGQSQNDRIIKEIRDYVEKSKKKNETERIAEGREKTGVFTGFYCINQLTNYKMPIWISDFVLMSVGTGAVVGVPGHDMRDFEFAKGFKIPVVRVVIGSDGDKSPITRREQVQEEEGKMVNSGFLNGMDIKKAIGAMMNHLEEKGWGKRVTTYKLRDWCISRQRYWGAPIPMIYCQNCADKGLGWLSLHQDNSHVSRIKYQVSGIKKEDKNIRNTKYVIRNTELMPGWYPVPEDQLPVLLPKDVKDWKPEGTGKGPLAKLKNWVSVACPECGAAARRETDVCDTFLDSSWYHLRYPSVGKNDVPWDPEITKKWLPVNQYIGGAEHTVLHLLYARFVWMCFYDWGLFDFSAQGGPASGWDEPYTRFYAHGLIIAEGAKMSKSKGNVVIPDEYIKAYGTDTLRTYLMFLGPFDMGGDFRDTGIAGMFRFLNRVWRLICEYTSNITAGDASGGPPTSAQDIGSEHLVGVTSGRTRKLELIRVMHRTIKEVTEDLENLRYNTAIAHIMTYVNELTNNQQLITNNHIKSLLLMLAPFAPHMTEELWNRIKYYVSGIKYEKEKNKNIRNTKYVIRDTNYQSIHLHPWPTFDPKYLVEDEVTIIIQVNGKTRDTIKVKSQSSKVKSEVEKAAKESEKVKKYLSGKTIKKAIFVPGKLINFVVI